MLHAQLAALALAATTLAASGCGGSSKSNSLTQAELVTKADAICARVKAELRANPFKSRQDFVSLAPQLASYEQTVIAELRKFIPPASMANDWKQIVDSSQINANDTAKLGEYAKQNNSKGISQMFSTSAGIQLKAEAIAKRDGFKECARTG